MQQALHAGRAASPDDFSGKLSMDAVKAATASAALVENANQVDDDFASAKLRRQLSCIVDVGIDQVEFRQHQQAAVCFAIAGEHFDDVSVVDQPRHEVPTDKAGTSKNANSCGFHHCWRALQRL